MANIIKEDVAVSDDGSGLLCITLIQIHDDGIDMGGKLVFDGSSLAWVKEELTKALEVWGYERTENAAGADLLRVFVGGSEMQPFVHVQNERDKAAPEGRIYALGMTVEAARSLSSQLAGL